MKLIKFLLGIISLAIIPLYALVMADDCFDTVIDREGNVYYIDPFDETSTFTNKNSLLSTYGDKINCKDETMVYSEEEYLNKLTRIIYSKQTQRQSETSSGEAIMELIMLILSCVALWKIFVKAGKSGIYSIIPIYNIYVLSDIAGLQKLFSKAFICLVLGIFVSFFIPILGMLLVCVFGIFCILVNFNVARNFGWSTIASILYVIFNPVAMLILAFGNDKYYMTEQQEKLKAIKAKMNAIDNGYTDNDVDATVGLNTQPNNNLQENNKEAEEPIKYLDPSNFG